MAWLLASASPRALSLARPLGEDEIRKDKETKEELNEYLLMLARHPTAPALACLIRRRGTGMMCRDHREYPETSSSAQEAVRVRREQQWYAGVRREQ